MNQIWNGKNKVGVGQMESWEWRGFEKGAAWRGLSTGWQVALIVQRQDCDLSGDPSMTRTSMSRVCGLTDRWESEEII